jgi:hypothetical protein
MATDNTMAVLMAFFSSIKFCSPTKWPTLMVVASPSELGIIRYSLGKKSLKSTVLYLCYRTKLSKICIFAQKTH